MYVSAQDAPSDIYGAVSDVSRPLIYKMNQATMQRSVYEALHALLVWALTNLEQGLQESLNVHEGVASIPSIIESEVLPTDILITEKAIEAAKIDAATTSIKAEPKPAKTPKTASVADAVPLTVESLGETPEDIALEAEVAALAAAPVVEPAVVAEVAAPAVEVTLKPV